MIDRINKRWVVVGVIWAVVLSIDYWNIGEMYRIREARARKVFLTMDEQFLRAHSEEISESLKKRDQANGGSIPITLSCEGSLRKMVECLEALRRDYAYVPVIKVTIEIENRGAPARCEISLNYRYKIVGPETQT